MLLGLSHGANQFNLVENEVHLNIGYMVIATSSNTLGKQPPCTAQVTKAQLCFANHHIITSQRHAIPALDPKRVGESTAQSLRTIIIHRIIITIIIAYVQEWVRVLS